MALTPVCGWDTFAHQTTSEILVIGHTMYDTFTAFKFVHPVPEVFYVRQNDF